MSYEFLGDFIRFVKELEEFFDISIFDLNYDNICDIALPEYSTGFEEGRFIPHSVHAHPYGKELYHIHGSIHFELDTDADGRDGMVVRKSDPNTVRNYSLYHEFEDERFDRSIVPQSSLVAGGQKSEQILREPFSSYFSVFTRRIYECDAILFCGYGFNDPHINRIIENRMRMIERPPPCFIIDYCPSEPFMADRSGAWARNVCKTLHLMKSQFIKSIYRTKNYQYTISDFGRQLLTENTGEGGTSIWRYGFKAALPRSQLISHFLYDSKNQRLNHQDWLTKLD